MCMIIIGCMGSNVKEDWYDCRMCEVGGEWVSE